jgi:hypothetical protein
MKSVMLSIMFVAVAMMSNEVKAQAKMDFKKEVHDYGNIKNGANGTCTFEFTNTGNAPLIISNATGSCGCTVPTWPKEPIAPGAKGEITVKYDTKRTGEFTKTVTLTSNSSEPNKVLTIKGNVAAPVEGASPVNTSGAPSH